MKLFGPTLSSSLRFERSLSEFYVLKLLLFSLRYWSDVEEDLSRCSIDPVNWLGVAAKYGEAGVAVEDVVVVIVEELGCGGANI